MPEQALRSSRAVLPVRVIASLAFTGRCMYILKPELLLPGDVVLSREATFLSKGIRFAARSEFSHAMLYVGFGSLIHADGDGVHAQNIQRILVKTEQDFRVMRLHSKNSYAQLRAIEFAKRVVGTQYTRIGALSSVLPTMRRRARLNRQFCSRLVAEAYAYGGIQLVSNPSFCSPAALAGATAQLRKVPDCVRAATDAELTMARSKSILVLQQDATNQIMSAARNLTGFDVQTIEQLFSALRNVPAADAGICATLADSGYLTLWQTEMSENPWRYSYEKFRNLNAEPGTLLDTAKFELESAGAQKAQYVQFLIALQTWPATWKSQVVAKFVELYRQLILVASQRMAVAKLVIDDLEAGAEAEKRGHPETSEKHPKAGTPRNLRQEDS